MNTTQGTDMKTPIYTIASGKGGVGKTSLVLNMCHILAKKGKRVLLLDADFGLANADVQLGVVPKGDLSAVVRGDKTLSDVVSPVMSHFDLIAGRSGDDQLAFMSALDKQGILAQLRILSDDYDVVFIDAAAGLDATTLALSAAADKTLLISTPDPSSMTDAYAVVKLLHTRQGVQNCVLLVNQAAGAEGKRVADKLQAASKNFLQIDLPVGGFLPADKQYGMAVKMQQVAAVAFPTCKVVVELEKILSRLRVR